MVTPEMESVARSEQLDPELIRDEVARGRMVIPANKVHLTKRLEPMGIGIAARTKINANIGNSAVTSDTRVRAGEAAHGGPLRRRHGDGPFHRRDIDAIRQPIIDAAPVPVGTVPIYQMCQQLDDIVDMRPQRFPRHGRAPGAAGRRLHDDPLRVLLEHLPLTDRRHRHRQPRRLADGQVDDRPPPAEPALHALRRPLRHHAPVRRHLEPGRRPAARLARRRQRRGPVRRAATCWAS